MQLLIDNFFQIKKAEINLSPGITMLCGNNAAGKTSAIRALQAVTTGETIPLKGVKKKDARLFVHDTSGAKSGSASLVLGDVTNSVKWPSCKKEITPLASVFAAGVVKPNEIPAKDLTQILGISPTKEDLTESLQAYGEVEELEALTESIWKRIEEGGWDEAHKQAIARRQSLKKEWEGFAGISWPGDVQAGTWTPDSYSGRTLEEIEQGIVAAEKIYEHALKSQALNEKERSDLEALADSAEKVQSEIDSAKTEVEAVTTSLEKSRTLLSQLPRILNAQKTYACWHCGELGVLQDEQLVKAPEQASAADVSAAKARYDEQSKIVRELESSKSLAEYTLRQAQNKLVECQKAKEKLENVDLTAEPTIDPVEAKVELVRCHTEREAFKAKEDCDSIYEGVGLSIYLCSVLDADGLRKEVLGKRLQEFNARLAALCAIAEWPLLELDETLDLRLAGRPFILLSDGQQLAVNAALQVAIAQIDGSKVVIIDHLERMDKFMKNGLFSVLLEQGFASVVGCKFDEPAEVPNLGELGISYWFENMTARPLYQEALTT